VHRDPFPAQRIVLVTESRLSCSSGVSDTPETAGLPDDAAALRAENGRLRMLVAEKDAQIATLTA
jgi:hypothetical protein